MQHNEVVQKKEEKCKDRKKVAIVAIAQGEGIKNMFKEMGADMNFAWPTAEIAVMGAKGAVNVLYGKELKSIEDPEQKKQKAQKYMQEYSDKFESPYQAASLGRITDVIEPAETRGVIALALRSILSKRATTLPKKNGNIPL